MRLGDGPYQEIGLEQQQVRRPELLPEEHHIQPRSKPLPKEPSVEERQAYELTHFPARSWCETRVKSFGLDDPHRLRRGGRDIPEIQVDYMFMGRRGEKELICALHAIDTGFLARVVTRADKGPIDIVISGMLEFLGEIWQQKDRDPQRQRTGGQGACSGGCVAQGGRDGD